MITPECKDEIVQYKKIHLTEIEKPKNVKKHVTVDVRLTVSRPASIIPHAFYLRCPVVDGNKKSCPARTKAEEDGKDEKFFCSLEKYSSDNPKIPYEHKIDCDSSMLLNAYQAKTQTVESIVYYNFPCRVDKFREVAQVRQPDYLSIRECVFYPDAKTIRSSEKNNESIDETGNPYRSQSLFYFTKNSDLLEPASSLKLFGQVLPHPRTQRPTIIVNRAEKSDSDVSQFKLTDEIREQFRRLNGISLDDMALQLSSMTQIYDRSLTHILVLLVYHSVLSFQYAGRNIKGTLDTILLGDAGVGKTQILKTLIQELRLGQFITGSCSSRTGLSYSFIQHDKDWEIQWGAYPSNDRGLLVIDEGQDITVEDWEKLSVARSEGVLTVDRVAKGEHPSRTRLIVLANPKHGRQVDSELYPCTHLKRLFATKDIRRFDIGLSLSTADVSRDILLQDADESTASKLLNAEILRNSVMYAWSRKPEQIQFQKEFNSDLSRYCAILLMKYGGAADIPLITSDIKHKLLRLSVAYATLRHSTDETGENVIVTPFDLECVVNLLTQIYSRSNFGLEAYASSQGEETVLHDSEFEIIRKDLIGDSLTKAGTLIRRKLIKLFAQTSELTGSELATSADLDRKTISGNLSSFKKYGLITAKRGSGYKSTAKFNHFVRRLPSVGINIQTIDQEDFMIKL